MARSNSVESISSLFEKNCIHSFPVDDWEAVDYDIWCSIDGMKKGRRRQCWKVTAISMSIESWEALLSDAAAWSVIDEISDDLQHNSGQADQTKPKKKPLTSWRNCAIADAGDIAWDGKVPKPALDEIKLSKGKVFEMTDDPWW